MKHQNLTATRGRLTLRPCLAGFAEHVPGVRITWLMKYAG